MQNFDRAHAGQYIPKLPGAGKAKNVVGKHERVDLSVLLDTVQLRAVVARLDRNPNDALASQLLTRHYGMVYKHPLLGAVLWHRRAPRTSQRQCAKVALSNRFSCVTGGNQTGKSWLAACLMVASVYGLDHPVVQYWLRLNRLPTWTVGENPDGGLYLPRESGNVWVYSPTYGLQIAQLRGHIRALVPEGSRFVMWESNAEARVHFPGNIGHITCRSFDAFYGAQHSSRISDRAESASLNAAFMDEEPRDRTLYDALKVRTMSRRGPVVHTCTSLKPAAASYVQQVFGLAPDYRAEPHTGSAAMDSADCPFLDSEAVEESLSALPEDVQMARRTGRGVLTAGLYWPVDWSAVIVRPNRGFIRHYLAIDWGSRNPHCLFIGEYIRGGLRCWTVYHEIAYRLSDGAISDHRFVGLIDDYCGTNEIRPAFVFPDSANRSANSELSALGYPVYLVNKSRIDNTGAPVLDAFVNGRLTLSPATPVTNAECMQFAPKCAHDHAPDCLRYFVQAMSDMGYV